MRILSVLPLFLALRSASGFVPPAARASSKFGLARSPSPFTPVSPSRSYSSTTSLSVVY